MVFQISQQLKCYLINGVLHTVVLYMRCQTNHNTSRMKI